MLEELNLAIWIPIGITIMGFISYYFGKIISDIQPTQEVKQLNYVGGFIFLLLYLLFPVAVIYEFRNILVLNLNLILIIVFFVIFCSLSFYLDKKKVLFQIQAGEASDLLKEKMQKHTEDLTDSIGLKIEDKYFQKIFRRFFLSIPSQNTILIISFIQIFLLTNLIMNSRFYFLDIFLVILFIPVINNIAILHIAKMIIYPSVLIKMNNGEKHKGRLTKIEPDFISIRKKRDIFHLVKSNVEFIQKNDGADKLDFEERFKPAKNLLSKIDLSKLNKKNEDKKERKVR